jgi:hypothetical protein
MIDGASVSYRIVRQAKFPVWYATYKRGYYEQFSEQMEIGSGTTTTDAAGSFNVFFTAIPDLKIPSKEKPQFTYRVYADVTDINGETRSSESFITAGYVSMNADINVPENVSKDSTSKWEIITENLNGTFEPANGTITIYSLEEPDRIFRNRLWKRPDQFVMSKEEYYKAFPNDVYDNEDDFTTWEKKSKAVDQTFNTETSKIFSSSEIAGLPQGKYLLELITKDKYGTELNVKKYFTLYSSKDKSVPLPLTFWSSALPGKALAGTVLELQFGTAEKEMTLIYEVQAKNDYRKRELLQWKKGKTSISLPVTENFKGWFEH